MILSSCILVLKADFFVVVPVQSSDGFLFLSWIEETKGKVQCTISQTTTVHAYRPSIVYWDPNPIADNGSWWWQQKPSGASRHKDVGVRTAELIMTKWCCASYVVFFKTSNLSVGRKGRRSVVLKSSSATNAEGRRSKVLEQRYMVMTVLAANG